MSEAHLHFQFEDVEHQADTALDGMWLFLAQEALFFGALVFAWLLNRHYHPLGYHRAAQQTDLLIGSINTMLLITSSATYAVGLRFIRLGDARWLFRLCAVTALLGSAFLALKGLEWHEDLDKHMNPGLYFGLSGPDAGGAQLFWCFYWVATVLHAVHMTVGIGLVLWLLYHIRRGAYSGAWHTPVEVVGIYWSFVDIIWLILYPLIYLVGRPG
jgi:cytochrome c oxidase subunit 3